MISFSAGASFGNGGKQYIARIIGRNPKFTFEREFIGRKGGKRNEDCEADTDEPGLYETRDIDNKGRPDDRYYVVANVGDQLVKSLSIEKESAMKIAKALQDGRRIDAIVELVGRPSKKDASITVYDCVLVTKKEAEQKAVAQTIDTATEACWAILQALPEKEAKKVLAALRIRVTPPKAAADLGMSDDAPVGVVSDASQETGATQTPDGFEPTPAKEGE